MEELFPYFKGKTSTLRLMNNRLGNQDLPRFKPDTVEGATEMAKRLKTNQGYYSLIENGKRKPSFIFIKKLSSVCEVTPEFIVSLL